AARSIVNWPLLSVVCTPKPGTLTCRPTSGMLTSAEIADWPLRVHAMTVIVVAVHVGAVRITAAGGRALVLVTGVVQHGAVARVDVVAADGAATLGVDVADR